MTERASRSPLASLLLIVYGLCGIYALYFGVLAALADVQTLRTRWLMDHGPRLLSQEDLAYMRDKLQLAERLTPANPEVHERLAALDMIQSSGNPLNDGLSKVRERYLEATRLRPMSPYAWARVADVSNRMKMHDETFWRAFDLAQRYGPNEKDVQIILAGIGYPLWGTLTEARRAQLSRAYLSAVPAQRKRLKEIADSVGLNPAVTVESSPYPTHK